MRSNNSFDYLPAVIAIFLWSTGAYFIFKMKHLPTCQILVIGQLTGGIMSAYLEGGRSSWRSLVTRLRKGWAILAVFWVSQYGYVYAFQNAPPAQIDLIFYTWPAILIALKAWSIKRKIDGWDFAGIGLGFFGIFVLLWPDLKENTVSLKYLSGYIGGVLGALGWVVYLLYTDQRIKNRRGFNSIGEDIFILGVLNLCIINIGNSWVVPSGLEWAMLFYYALSMFGVPYYLWRITLQKNPKMAGALSNATPVLSIVWLVIAGITPFTIELIIAVCMVNLGIYCINKSTRAYPQVDEYADWR